MRAKGRKGRDRRRRKDRVHVVLPTILVGRVAEGAAYARTKAKPRDTRQVVNEAKAQRRAAKRREASALMLVGELPRAVKNCQSNLRMTPSVRMDVSGQKKGRNKNEYAEKDGPRHGENPFNMYLRAPETFDDGRISAIAIRLCISIEAKHMDEPDWHLYRSFLAVMRAGSLSAAARALSLTQPTLGRHVAELEAALGFALFTRSPSGLVPTEEAERLRPSAEAVEFSVRELLNIAKAREGDDSVMGTVRLTASEGIGTEVLPPLLAPIQHKHPGLAIDLRLSNQVEDLLRRDADIAVRSKRPKQNAIIAKKVGAIEIGLFAHRRYIETFGCPSRPNELKEHLLIGFDNDPSRGGTSDRELSVQLQRSDFRYRSDSLLAQHAAVRAGVGIGPMQTSVAARDDQLLPILPESIGFTFELWLAMHEDQRRRAPVRHVFNALAESMQVWCGS